MTTLNKIAAEVIRGDAGTEAFVGAKPDVEEPEAESRTPDFKFSTMTDVTGFGLIGHARELLLASDVSIRLHVGQIPLLEGAIDCIHAGHIPGGLTNNRNFAECLVEYDADVPEDLRAMLYDPQTAGGLLILHSKRRRAYAGPPPKPEFQQFKSARSFRPTKPRISVTK